MKSLFKHREAILSAHEMERNNTYANALIVENKRLRDEVVELRAERDAMAKSIRIVSEPIETIQPRGITE